MQRKRRTGRARAAGDGHPPVSVDVPTLRRTRPRPIMDLWDVLRIVRARRATLVLATLFTGVLALLSAVFQKPVYLATSLVLIEPRKPKIASGEEVFDPNQNTGTVLLDYYRTEYEILKSRTILEPVARSLGIADREEFRSAPDPVAEFAATVKAEPVRDSRLVRVSVASPSPVFAAQATDAIVTRFIEENADRLSRINETGLNKLRALAADLKPHYEKAVAEVESFKSANALFVPGALASDSQLPEFEQLRNLSEQLTLARIQRSRLQSEVAAIVAHVDSRIPTVPAPSTNTRSVFEDILVERGRAAAELDDLRGFFKPGHPELKAAEARLATADRRLAEETERTIHRLRMEASAAEAQEERLAAAVAAAGQAAGITAERASRLKVLAEEATTLSETYKAVTKRLGELEIQSATDAKEQNIFVLDRARTSPVPIAPRKKTIVAAGLVLGTIAGLLLCLLAELVDNRVKSRDDLERIVAKPVLGFVPRVASGSWTEPAIPELEAMYSPRSSFAENLRSIRTGLSFLMPPGTARVVLVTSADPQDGKTTVSINLAITLAQAGQRVLLIDANLRRSKLHEFFDVSGSTAGLSTILASGDPNALDAVCPTKYPYLDVLPAGPAPPNPAELLGSDVTKAFLENALATYAWIVIDAPPAALADPLVLLAYVPTYLLVVRLFATAKASLARARDLLARTPARAVGLVVNTADVPKNLETSEEYGPGIVRGPRAVSPAPARVLAFLALATAALSAGLFARARSHSPGPTIELAPGKLPSVTFEQQEDVAPWAVASAFGLVAVGLGVAGALAHRRAALAARAAGTQRPFTPPPVPAWLSAGGASWGLQVPELRRGSSVAAPAPAPAAAAPAPAAAPAGPALLVDENAPGVVELQPSVCNADRSITQVTITGRNLDQVIAVKLHDVPCVLHPATEPTKRLVSVPAYLIQDGQWHFQLETPRGVAMSAAPFTILAPPPPVVTVVRPNEVPHNAADPPTLDVSGQHFTRLIGVRLVDPSGSSACAIVTAPDPEPNDQHVVVRLSPEVRPGAYRVVVETRSGTSDGGPTVTVQPDLLDAIEGLRAKLFRKLKLEGLDPGLKERVETLLWEGKDLDDATRASLKPGQLGASIAAEDLSELHDDLAKILRNDRARGPLEKLREKCPEWIADTAELALARFVADMEPRVKSPSDADVEGYQKAAASALRLLRVGDAFVFDSARTRRLKRSLQTVLALYREKDLLHVLSKIKDHLAAVVGATLPEASDDPESGIT